MDYKEKVIALLNRQELSKEQKEKLETIFPELKESKDEKIRKEIVDYLRDFIPHHDVGLVMKSKVWIAWLENIGEQKPIINESLKDVILSIWDLESEWEELTNCNIMTEHGTKLDFILKHWNEREPLKQIDWLEKQGENLYYKNKQPLKEHVEEKEDSKYERISDFYEGFAIVQLNEKENFIDKNGKILSNQWFDYVGDFQEGFAMVNLNGKWNFIDKNGKLLSPNQWFEGCSGFLYGLARVRLNGKHNYIDHNGNLYDTNFQPIHMNKVGLD